MLEPVKHILSSKRIILASGSPRRRELLHNIGVKCEIIPSTFEENLDPKEYTPDVFVTETAKFKVLEVAERLSSDTRRPDIIIGCDTTVALGDTMLGKPTNKENAFEMLSMLSGKAHTVYTGVVLKTQSKTVSFCESTKVYFAKLSPEVIKGYIETGEPMDKAGGYGIQSIGGSLIEKIDGDYFTVMGLPLCSLSKHILQLLNEKSV
ncbi:putative bifunctional dTTP/UTP pyrophosphatase/methyltransferase protein [Frankliniella fusca]|uniref:Bifunctional dTTP/UTP pyrophosphatase/methyltransferase protein n=1 Tax=Frankliniella fusca TaxID=407009 RepID=A0AAE1LSU7_9NEOP|nr:putative bifunctional dTTP/UTP pyrophosphatase/methyltransferase protein [Frankliniella fusca]